MLATLYFLLPVLLTARMVLSLLCSFEVHLPNMQSECWQQLWASVTASVTAPALAMSGTRTAAAAAAARVCSRAQHATCQQSSRPECCKVALDVW
mgnify:CR=1 FL=1